MGSEMCIRDSIKTALIGAFGRTQAAKDAEILNMSGLGDRTPTGLLRHMRSLNADPDTLFQLPVEARRVLAASSAADLDALAREADDIVETSRLHAGPALVAAAKYSSPARSSGQVHDTKSTATCFFHTKFGQAARNCREGPCPMRHLVPPTSAAPTFAPTSTTASGNAAAGR